MEQLAAHKRADFTCSDDRVGSRLREIVLRNAKRIYAACLVPREISTDRWAGFYPLSSRNLPMTQAPPSLIGKLPPARPCPQC